MIHEALLVLWNSDVSKDWIDSPELQEFLHPGEHALLHRIFNIAARYGELEAFRKTVATGLYLKAFCEGLDTVLQLYRDRLVAIEHAFLDNSQLALSYIVCEVESFVTMFQVLFSMIRRIKEARIHGCLLIGELRMINCCGIEHVVNAAKCITVSVNQMFYRHLCNWIVYGEIYDVYGEFFICDGQCPDENFLYPERSSEMPKKQGMKSPASVRKFFIQDEMVPSVLSLETANTILFMGRIVWILRNAPGKSSDARFEPKLQKDVWGGKEWEYYRKIQAHENEAFNLIAFDRTLEECRLVLSKHLWTIMVEEAQLMEHLQLIRDYFALGRGELFQQFIVAAEQHLRGAPGKNVTSDLNAIFKETARNLYGDHDLTYARFTLLWPESEQKDDRATPLSGLEMDMEIQWPLHVFFHPKAMQLYNKLFSFLLRLKKTHINLHRLWMSHMKRDTGIDRNVCFLRHNLMFLVNSLQYYLQVDVVEAQFSALKESVRNARDCEVIMKAHSSFLTNLLISGLVMVKIEKKRHWSSTDNLYQAPALSDDCESGIYHLIVPLLDQCDKFCAEAFMWDATLTDLQRSELNLCQETVGVLVKKLKDNLYLLHGKDASSQHMLHLMQRLDFDSYNKFN